ncbi:MAG: hypothetical protein EA349_03730 [Halomonadaceae bacterium]|nr:MAG: hypothetical protein EA349_03730 [Halomonadaceae bacterium]
MPLPLLAWGAIAAGTTILTAVTGAYAVSESSSSSSNGNAAQNERKRAQAKEDAERLHEQKNRAAHTMTAKKFVADIYGEDSAALLTDSGDPETFRTSLQWICTEKKPLVVRVYNSDLAKLRKRNRTLHSALGVLGQLKESE